MRFAAGFAFAGWPCCKARAVLAPQHCGTPCGIWRSVVGVNLALYAAHSTRRAFHPAGDGSPGFPRCKMNLGQEEASCQEPKASIPSSCLERGAKAPAWKRLLIGTTT